MGPDPLAGTGGNVLPTDKGMPAWSVGMSIADFVATRPSVHSGGFFHPLLTADGAALDGNISAMADYVKQQGALLCPHGKTTMSPQVVRRQLEAGAWGITAATISQVRSFRAFGVRRILLANDLVDPAGLDWVLEELDRDPEFEFYAYVDSAAGLDLVRASIGRRSPVRPLQLLVELGVPDGRTGCRTVAEAVALARSVREVQGVRLAGLAGYEGVLGHDNDAGTLSAVRGYLRDLRAALQAIAEDGPALADLIISAGGSMWFDLVLDELGPRATGGLARLVLRSGCYAAHDHGTYRSSGPSSRGHGPQLRPALRLWADILSTPEPDLAIAGFGRRDCSFDMGLPIPLQRLASDGRCEPVEATWTRELNDQHAFLAHDGSLRVGDVLSFGISHPCTTFDKWRLIPVIDEELRIVDCLVTWF